MHIDHPVALTVDQRRQFMHPLPVIGVVIAVLLHPFPACGDQLRFCLLQPVPVEQDVEVADEPTFPGLEPCSGVGSALQQ